MGSLGCLFVAVLFLRQAHALELRLVLNLQFSHLLNMPQLQGCATGPHFNYTTPRQQLIGEHRSTTSS